MSVNPASGPAGTQVAVTGSGFYAGETVTLYWDGGTVLGHAKTTATGSFTHDDHDPPRPRPVRMSSPPAAITPGAAFAGTNVTFTVTG